MIRKVSDPTETAFAIAPNIVQQVKDCIDLKYNDNEIKTTIAPLLSNTMFHRENQILENERWDTVFNLAKVLEKDQFDKAINSLAYKLKLE